jgi:hypothetical protein
MIMRTILSGINWENLSKETPPRLLPYLPATCADGPEFWGDSEVITFFGPYENVFICLQGNRHY